MIVTDNEVLLIDSELSQYYNAIQILQDWLLDKGNTDPLIENACKEVLEFLKAGTKVKRKKVFKDFFSQDDQEQLKKIVNILNKTQEFDWLSAQLIKDELIEVGMLSLTKSYLERVAPPTDKKIHASEFTKWLQGDIKPIIEQLRAEYEEELVSEELVKKFTKAFRKFSGKKIIIRITEVSNKSVAGIPLELTVEGYREMQHPFLEIPWEVSAPIDNALFEIDEIVEAYYNESRNENYRHLLIFVDFRNAIPVAKSLVDTLEVILKSTQAKDIMAHLQMPEEPALLEAYIVNKLVEKSAPLKKQVSTALEDVNKQLQQLELKQQDLKNEEINLDSESKKWQEIINRIEYFKRIEQSEEKTTDEKYEIYDYEPDTFINRLQSLIYHNDEQELVYQDDIIRSFAYALRANVLTVLAGPSGTGKSSIVHAFARAVQNVEVRMVPVQSSWTDTQDLLGYFHPTDKAFVPTPFMEAMVEAKKEENSQKIFLICLDEMNLAHVEYYFSEILSAREGRTQEIHLYPKRHWETAKIILAEGKAELERIQSATELIEHYPPVFHIPPNVRFIGTLNMDHTVKPLSPKVIDRSFIIEINHLKVQEKKDLIASFEGIEGKIAMNYQTFIESNMEVTSVQRYMDRLQELSSLFENYPNASLNSRGLKHLTTILTYCQLDSEMESLMDRLIYGKILPRLEIKKTDFVQQENVIFNQIQSYPKSFEKLQKMLDVKHTISFW